MSCDCGCGDWNLANADIAVLKQLREGVLADLPMSVWQSLIVDVEKAGGVLSVQGTAGKVIREAVQKASSSPAWQRKVKASEPSDEVDFEKGKFASRSEAARYAAQQRWKGNANESPLADGAVPTSNIFGAGQAMNMESIRGAHEGALRSVKEGSRAFKELQLAQEDLVASSRADVTGNAFDAWNLGASAEFRVRQLAEASGAKAPVKRLHKMLQQLVLDLTDAYYAESETNDSIDYPDYDRERRNTEPTTLRVNGKSRTYKPTQVKASQIVKGDIVRNNSAVEARRVVGFGGDTRNDASVGEKPVVLITQSLDSNDGKLLTSSSSGDFKLVRFDEVVGKAMPQGAGDPRSNAGRYAAEQRWKGHTKKTEIDANLRQQGKTPIAGGETNQDPSGNVIDTLVEALSQYKAGNQVVVPAESVYTVLEELAAFAKDAKDKGDKATDLDLCKVSVPGTNLFCGENKGLLREEMPQLSGVPSKGSPADGMEKDKKGRANIGEAFVEHLRDGGVETREGEVPASSLKATQKQVIGADVAGIMKALEDGSMPEQTIFVSRDGYVIDGHHRWAATVGLDFKDGKGGDLKIKVRVIDLSIDEVLKKANAFADEMGMPRRSGDANADAKRKGNDDVPSKGDGKGKDKKKSKGKKTEG